MYEPHVLLIDDDDAVRRAAHMFLKVAGYRVSAATCTAEAVEHARLHHDFDVVISDYHLGPGETGIDAIAAVRAVRGAGLRAVLMSGDTGLHLKDVERGPDTSIAHKPINPDELLALLPARRARARLTAQDDHRRKKALDQSAGPKAKITLDDVRLDPTGTRVVVAALHYCRRVVWNDKTVVKREAGADWSEVAAAINEARKARNQQHLDTRKPSGRNDAPQSPAEFDCAPWREEEIAVDCWRDGKVIDDPMVCTTCGNQFMQFAARMGAVCSEKCKPKRPSQAKPRQHRACAACGTTFAPKRSTTRACSTKCRVAMLRGDTGAPALRKRRGRPRRSGSDAERAK